MVLTRYYLETCFEGYDIFDFDKDVLIDAFIYSLEGMKNRKIVQTRYALYAASIIEDIQQYHELIMKNLFVLSVGQGRLLKV